MKCPYCPSEESRVIDSRPAPVGIRRRRECELCHRRFNTLEMAELVAPSVVKKDGRREAFSRDKVSAGMRLACRKRPIPSDRFDEAVDEVTRAILWSGEKEVSSALIGQRILEALRALDPVAYLRFASVYLELQSAEAFLDLARAVCAERPT